MHTKPFSFTGGGIATQPAASRKLHGRSTKKTTEPRSAFACSTMTAAFIRCTVYYSTDIMGLLIPATGTTSSTTILLTHGFSIGPKWESTQIFYGISNSAIVAGPSLKFSVWNGSERFC